MTAPLDYAALRETAAVFPARWPGLVTVDSFGRSVLGRELWRFRIGSGAHRVLYVGGHHALEWLAAQALLCLAEEFCRAWESDTAYSGFDARYIARTRTIDVVPMLNPDGVELVLHGAASGYALRESLLGQNGGADFSRRWQANAHGVDLNHNYDADWPATVEAMAQLGVTAPGPTRWPGEAPESEPETRALCDLIRSEPPERLLSFHSQGEEIYYDFQGRAPRGAESIARIFARVTGYRPAQPPAAAAAGGCKDWFISAFDRPGFTIEMGRGENPLPISQLSALCGRCRELFVLAAIL